MTQIDRPFWSSTAVTGDPLFFAETATGDARASLLFPPDGGVAIREASGAVAYEQGRDFVVDAAAGVVIRTPGSRMPITSQAELYPSVDPDGSTFMFRRGAPGSYLMCGEGDLFHRRQVRATYTHAPGLWTGFTPAFRGDAVPRTLGCLRAGEPLSIAVTGDSISEGYNASGFVGVPPHQPPYAELVAEGLRSSYRSAIALHNFASAGWTTDNGLADVDRVAEDVPDLVIVAYGMNDAGYATAPGFAANIAGIMREIRRTAPAAEFVLVSPMLPNPDWHYTVTERFIEYRDALDALTGDGAILADVTTMWHTLLARKSFYDLTGNGINHPNDFGHRVYAEVMLALLTQS